MTLTRHQVGTLIDIIAQDARCRSFIGTTVSSLPPVLGLSGQLRNSKNSIGDSFSSDYSQKTENEMCRGICAAAVYAISTQLIARKLPWLKKICDQRNDPAWFGHFAPLLTTANGGEYIIDWWMTLSIHNPIVWLYEDWRQYPNPMVLNRGVQFYNFNGFGG